MTTPDSLEALRRANPRTRPDFAESVEATALAIRARLAEEPARRSRPRGRLVGLSAAGVALATAAAAVLLLTIGSSGSGPGVQDAAAAVKKAATLTAAAAERSGTVTVRVTHDGRLWAGTTIRWNGDDLAQRGDAPDRRGKVGSLFLVVDGMMYATDPETGGWSEMGSPASIDPDSGTTPAENLAAVREDVGGATLRRFTDNMTGLTMHGRADGSTVYRGSVAAGLIARETGFKEGQALRVFPFGYVAHDQAANPDALLDVAVTVGPDGILREIEVSWGTWTYRVAYTKLGATAAPVAPANARPLRRGR